MFTSKHRHRCRHVEMWTKVQKQVRKRTNIFVNNLCNNKRTHLKEKELTDVDVNAVKLGELTDSGQSFV